MSKKQIATIVAALLSAVAAVLTQCPDSPAPSPTPVSADAGAPDAG